MNRAAMQRSLGRAAYVVNAWAYNTEKGVATTLQEPGPRARCIAALKDLSERLGGELASVPVRSGATPMRAVDEVLDVVSSCAEPDAEVDLVGLIRVAREFVGAAEDLYLGSN